MAKIDLKFMKMDRKTARAMGNKVTPKKSKAGKKEKPTK